MKQEWSWNCGVHKTALDGYPKEGYLNLYFALGPSLILKNLLFCVSGCPGNMAA